MRAFDYLRPSSIEEACAYLAQGDESVKVLAGGTDLLVQMKQGKLHPKALVSLRGIPDLSFCRLGEDGVLTMGATAPLGLVEYSEDVRRRFPGVAMAASRIGSVQVRTRATVGGNLCNAAPSADMAPVLIALGTEVVITGANGERIVPLEGFFTGPGTTVLRQGELVTSIRVPPLPSKSFATYEKASRSAMDIATVGVGLLAVFEPRPLSKSLVVHEARLVLGAVAPTPIRAVRAEDMLAGKVLEPELIAAASHAAAEEAKPISDVRASAEYRKTLVEVLSRRVLRAAYEWAAKGG